MPAFFCPGIPQPKGSKTVMRGRVVESADLRRKTRPAGALRHWMVAVGAAAKIARVPLITGPVSLVCTFYLPRPKKPRADVPDGPPDASKLARAVEDAIEGIGYRNDGQIVELLARKRYARDRFEPGVLVEIAPWDG